MTIPAVVRDLLLGGSFAAVGLLAYMGGIRVVSFARYRRHIDGVYARFDLGVAVVVGLIAEAVFKIPTPRLTWRLGVYIVALYVIVQAAYSLARNFHRRDRRRTDRRDHG